MPDAISAIEGTAHDMIEAKPGFPVLNDLFKCGRKIGGSFAEFLHGKISVSEIS
jgi:hypothetical protein